MALCLYLWYNTELKNFDLLWKNQCYYTKNCENLIYYRKNDGTVSKTTELAFAMEK